tara:strand:+ start:268 stop:486 length:219 start_codon:yes stop_codon:yes gene_type:complete
MKNKPSIPKRGRGRPRKIKPDKIVWKLPEGIRFVSRRADHPQAFTHRWLAYKNNQVVGYYRTIKEAEDALNK